MQDSSTKNKILLSAGPIFADKGYDSATVREICEAAAVNVASVNYYFGDKAQLYLATVQEARRRRAEQFPILESSVSNDPLQQLRGFINSLLNRLMALQSAPWELRLLMREVMHPTDACRHLSEEYFRPVFNRLLGIIRKISIRTLSDHEVEKMGYSVIGQILFYRYSADMIKLTTPHDTRKEHYDIEQLTDHIFHFSTAGILAANELSSAVVKNEIVKN